MATPGQGKEQPACKWEPFKWPVGCVMNNPGITQIIGTKIITLQCLVCGSHSMRLTTNFEGEGKN